jgi:hypothetical protein
MTLTSALHGLFSSRFLLAPRPALFGWALSSARGGHTGRMDFSSDTTTERVRMSYTRK